MNAGRLVPLVLALACIVAIGGTATSLQSSVKTTPDDAIDLSKVSLPIGDDQLQQYDRQLNGPTTQVPDPADDSESGSRDPVSVSRPTQVSRELRQQNQPQETSTSGERPDDPSLLERLLALLAALLDLLRSLLPALVALVLFAAAVRYRGRLAAALGGEREPPEASPDAVPVGEPAPDNEVAQAWWEMVSELGVERPETKTPRECAAAAAADADGSVVERLTEAFEEVRYGHAPITEEHRRRAREGRRWVRAYRGKGA